ncbi:hypothetical protein SBF1_6870002 [Candidatus Desulfosporosinus infrequens]|uniref:Uncharacterized protein n=1 Tax=Candidatus Desulfosporosinus infrequens TaxID=2043169 RepID=A0A2U3LNW6_9FIRM|nr:hypothetical protein SBF1_6870002 [Candidatus Desulfosporosinus infrequens]
MEKTFRKSNLIKAYERKLQVKDALDILRQIKKTWLASNRNAGGCLSCTYASRKYTTLVILSD